MIQRGKVLVLDVDGTLCPVKEKGTEYSDVLPHEDVVRRVREYKELGFHIVLCTARNMNTHGGNVGLITASTAKVLLAWLDRHQIPYDELHVGKPWAGADGFYVDDKAIRPDEFLKLSYSEIRALLSLDAR